MAKTNNKPKFSATVKVIKKEGDVKDGNRQHSNNSNS